MPIKKTRIEVCQILNKPHFDNSQYKYLIDDYSMNSYICAKSAFITDNGFNQFIKVYNFKELKSLRVINDNGKNKVLVRVYESLCKEKFFWHKFDLPKNVKSFIALENGAYVKCYYADEEGIRVIYKPNPNAKEVYKELDYFVCSKKYG